MDLTFITATIGRASIQATADSIRAQTDPGWRWFIGGDGINPSPLLKYPSLAECFKFPPFRHESPVRNALVDVAPTEWVAFVDDDDTLSPHYVEWWREECAGNDIVIFRQTLPLDNGEEAVFPLRPEIVWGNVGISYAVKREWARRAPFKQTRHEDLLQLVALEALGAKVHFSPHIAYYGRDHRA